MSFNLRPPDYQKIALKALNQIPAMVAYWDTNQICRFANSAYYEWFGKKPEEMINRISMAELLGPLYIKNQIFIMGAIGGETHQFEREIKTPSGEIKHTLASYNPDIVDGSVLGFTAHVTDITRIKNLGDYVLRKENKIREKLKESKPDNNSKINIKYLEELAPAGDNEFVFQVLKIFQNETTKYLDSVIYLAEAFKFPELRRFVHKIKPLGDYIGSESYAQVVEELEQAIINEDDFQTALMVTKLKNTIEAINAEIYAYKVYQEKQLLRR